MDKLPLPPPFAEQLSFKRVDTGQYVVEVSESLSFGPRIFGGAIISAVRQVAEHYSPAERKHPDAHHIQLQFLRLIVPGEVSISLQDVSVSRSASIIKLAVSQEEKECVVGYVNMTDLGNRRGLSINTNWKLEPMPPDASPAQLTAGANPNWFSYQRPYHPDGVFRAQTFTRFYIPRKLLDPSIWDHWIRPSRPDEKFTSASVGFVADNFIPLLDNFFPREKALGHHANVMETGLKQAEADKADKIDSLVAEDLDSAMMMYDTPATYMSLAFTLDIKRKLPAEGVDWLFLRARLLHVENGRMNIELTILDEHKQLIALSHQLCQIIDLARSRGNKQKL